MHWKGTYSVLYGRYLTVFDYIFLFMCISIIGLYIKRIIFFEQNYVRARTKVSFRNGEPELYNIVMCMKMIVIIIL